MLKLLLALLRALRPAPAPDPAPTPVPAPIEPSKPEPVPATPVPVSKGPMKISRAGIEHIKRFEGLKLKAYLCPANVWTIGYGHTGTSAARQGNYITEAIAEELLRKDLERFEEGVNRIGGKMTQGQYDALVSFAFNLGLGALMKSTLLKRHKAGDYQRAGDEFLRWVNAGGRKLNGLVKRRAIERVMYLSGGKP